MSRLLLVESRPERADRLSRALTQEGFSVKVAPEGFYALTMMEREQADLLLLDGAEEDLPAAELATIVRSDPGLAGVVLAVMIHPTEPEPEGFDLVVDGGLSEVELAATIRRRTRKDKNPETVVVRGSLDIQDLLQLMGTLGHARQTGRLSLVFPSHRLAEVYFDRGQVVHARFGAVHGRGAFTGLFEVAQALGEVTFDFEILRCEEILRYPRTLEADVQGLLLTTVVDLDEICHQRDRNRKRTI